MRALAALSFVAPAQTKKAPTQGTALLRRAGPEAQGGEGRAQDRRHRDRRGGGGLLGNQIGGGSGKKIATAAGAVGGVIAGRKIQENQQNKTETVTERRCD